MRRFDALILGAGIVGVSTAQHLQAKGMNVALVDRKGSGEETSYGNAGIIETSSAFPPHFPKGLGNLAALAFNRSNAVHVDFLFLPCMLRWLAAHRWAAAERNLLAIGEALRALLRHALAEHEALAASSGQSGILHENGRLDICLSKPGAVAARRQARLAAEYDVPSEILDPHALRMSEPSLRAEPAGAVHWPSVRWMKEPGRFVKRMAEAFETRGGTCLAADAFSLENASGRWQVNARGFTAGANHAVVALGPWAKEHAARLGYAMPLLAMRGYHRRFEYAGTRLSRPVFVREGAFMLVPQEHGVKILTGVELAPHMAPPNPLQLDRAVAQASSLLALGSAIDSEPWLGSRLCLPDMLPVIGPAPRHRGLWFALGHGHYGLTMGPVTGRLISEMMTGEEPVVDPRPYRADRF